MGLRINTNILSLTAQRNLGNTEAALATALERLSSGQRINHAGDDAAGLAISVGLASEIRGLNVCVRNGNDGIGFLNTADGALAVLTDITQRLRELAVQSSNGTYSSTERTSMNQEKTQLLSEFQRIATQTEFNGATLLDGSFATTDLQVGVEKGDTIAFSLGDGRATTLGAIASKSGVQNNLSAATANLLINGAAIGQAVATDDTVSSCGNAYSAIAVAAEIAKLQGTTNVEADVNATVSSVNAMDFSQWTSGALTGTQLQLNGIAVTGTSITSASAFVNLVNQYASQTGVQARLQTGSTTGIQFYANDGRNIEVNISAASDSTAFYSVLNDATNIGTVSTGGPFSASAVLSAGMDKVITGSITLRSASSITVAGTGVSTAIGFGAAVTTVNPAVTVNNIDLTTQNNAQSALFVLDTTLNQLSTLRAGIGATQSRLNSAISSVQVTVENLSSAKSQIADADVAQETADLTRAQILQQAGVAVLGQANASSQVALQLLKF